jgi:alpha-tubulin suppressor-like RCC1 family protein
VQLALGDAFTCALLEGGEEWCWGQGFGALASTFSIDPLPIAGAANVAQIAATRDGLCLRQRSGVVRCVGQNGNGQLGDGTRDARATLGVAAGITDARDLGCGDAHCCATRRSGQSVCWGRNDRGQLGVGDVADRARPTSVASMLWSRR